VNESLDKRAKLLLAADISISSRKDLSQEQKEKVDKYLEPFLEDYAFSNEIYSMGQEQSLKKRSRLIQIKMITDSFPLYGELSASDLGAASKLSSVETKTWISKELAHQLKLSTGSQLKLGKLTFTVDGVITKDTTNSSRGISLAPKLYIHHAHQKNLGLVSQGSVASYNHFFKLNKLGQSKIKDLQKEILKILDDKAFKVLLPENSSEQVGRILNYLSDYLGLVSLVAIFLSAIGAAFLFQDFVFRKIVDIAILKSLGLTVINIYQMFVLQILLLGFSAISISSVVGSIILPFGSQYLSSFLSVPVSLRVGIESLVISFFIGTVFVLIICFPIIHKLVQKKAADLFGGEKGISWEFDKRDILKFLPLVLVIYSLSVWQAHSFAIGSVFTFILVISSSVLFLIVPKLLAFIDFSFTRNKTRIGRFMNPEFGLSVRFLSREKIATTLTFLSISLGVMLLSIISQLEVSLNKELLSDNLEKPSLFMFDIQAEQKEELFHFTLKNSIPLDNLTPMVRARISKVDGVRFDREKGEGFQTREDEQRIRSRNRGVNLTYSNQLNKSQTIVEGHPFKGVYSGSGDFEVSLESRYASRIKAKVGSSITFDILGVEFKGVVTSIRKIKWTSFSPNFFITLQEGVVEDAPQTYLGVLGELSTQRQLDVQDLIVDRFPNISMINVTELLEKITKIFSSMSLAIKVMAYLCILVGLFVVYGIIQNQLRRKQYDILLLKSFGMSEGRIIKVFIYQFLKVSFAASLLGCSLSLIVGNLLSQFFFEGVWSIDWMYFVSILFAITTLTIFLVLISASSVYKKPIRSLLE
jgi:putative ABC transport system permease protein